MKKSKEADAIKAAFYKRLAKERAAAMGVDAGEVVVPEDNDVAAEGEDAAPAEGQNEQETAGEAAELNPFAILENGYKAN